MDDPLRVRLARRVADLQRDVERARQRHRAARRGERALERQPVEVLHDDVQRAVRELPGEEDVHDVRVRRGARRPWPRDGSARRAAGSPRARGGGSSPRRRGRCPVWKARYTRPIAPMPDELPDLDVPEDLAPEVGVGRRRGGDRRSGEVRRAASRRASRRARRPGSARRTTGRPSAAASRAHRCAVPGPAHGGGRGRAGAPVPGGSASASERHGVPMLAARGPRRACCVPTGRRRRVAYRRALCLEFAPQSCPMARPLDAGAATWSVQLPQFEGPLDLLLHLCQKHELDILDIPIGFVTEKYLEYLAVMQLHASSTWPREYLYGGDARAHQVQDAPACPAAGAGGRGEPRTRRTRARRSSGACSSTRSTSTRASSSPRAASPGATCSARVPVEEAVNTGLPPLAEVPLFSLVEAFQRCSTGARSSSRTTSSPTASA